MLSRLNICREPRDDFNISKHTHSPPRYDEETVFFFLSLFYNFSFSLLLFSLFLSFLPFLFFLPFFLSLSFFLFGKPYSHCALKNGSPPRTRPAYNAQDQRASIVSIVCLYAAPRCLRIFNLKHEFPYGHFVVPELRILSFLSHPFLIYTHTHEERTKLFISTLRFPSPLCPPVPFFHTPYLRRIIPKRKRIPPFTVSLNTYSPRVYGRQSNRQFVNRA